MDNQQNRQQADIIWGVPAIARELGRSVSSVYYLIKKGRLPVKKIGYRTIIASRRALRQIADPDTEKK